MNKPNNKKQMVNEELSFSFSDFEGKDINELIDALKEIEVKYKPNKLILDLDYAYDTTYYKILKYKARVKQEEATYNLYKISLKEELEKLTAKIRNIEELD